MKDLYSRFPHDDDSCYNIGPRLMRLLCHRRWRLRTWSRAAEWECLTL